MVISSNKKPSQDKNDPKDITDFGIAFEKIQGLKEFEREKKTVEESGEKGYATLGNDRYVYRKNPDGPIFSRKKKRVWAKLPK